MEDVEKGRIRIWQRASNPTDKYNMYSFGVRPDFNGSPRELETRQFMRIHAE